MVFFASYSGIHASILMNKTTIKKAYSMFPFERNELIMQAVCEKQFISINELLKITNSSLTTLRRDINYLAENGKIKKTRGGITFIAEIAFNNSSFFYKNREKFFHEEKIAIGIAVQNIIEDGDIIILTNGTTTYQVARHIDEKKHVTVLTNGIDIVSALSNKSNIEVILLGGVINYSHNVIAGPSVPKMLQDFNPSKIISGAGGISEEKGITIYDFMGSSYFIKLFEKADEKIVVADHSKFDRNVLVQIAPLEAIDSIVTDKEVPPKYIEIFKKKNINYILA